METTSTAVLTLLEELETKELTNKKGEPYKLHRIKAKSTTKGKEFEVVMFLPPNEAVELLKERPFQLTKSQYGGWIAKEVKPVNNTGNRFPARNVTLDVWKIALETACSISLQRDAPSIIAVASEIAKHLKKQL